MNMISIAFELNLQKYGLQSSYSNPYQIFEFFLINWVIYCNYKFSINYMW